MNECEIFTKKPVFTAGFKQTHFSLSDIWTLKVFMRGVLPELDVEINNYFHENIHVLMELPILEVCCMISNRFKRQECEELCEMMDFVMTSLMGHRKIDIMLYNFDGFFVDIDYRTDDTGAIDSIYIVSAKPGSIVSGGSLNLLRKIGSGAFSDVSLVLYREKSSTPWRPFAMKFFNAGCWEKAMKDFGKELGILHIIRGIGGVIEHDFVLQASFLGQQYFAYGMPYFKNETLYKYTADLTITDTLKMLEPLAQAMKRCHERCVFHCDLKPENILVTDNGNPVLSDWGIAKQADSKCWSLNASTLIYTSWFRDPWNWREKKDFKASVLSEIWALLLSFLDCLSRGEFRRDEKFEVFRSGAYFGLKSQANVDNAIDSVFDSDCSPACTFFKKWLNIKRVMNITTTVPPDHPTMFDDIYGEFFHDLNLVLDTLKPNDQLCKTESSD